MRIDYLITGLSMGGAEQQVVSLAEQMQQRGYGVRVITLTSLQAAVFTRRLAQAGVPVISLGMTSGLSLITALPRLIGVLREDMPDILHGHMVHANIMARLAHLFIRQMSVISTAHSIHEGGRVRDWAYRLTNWLSELNTTVSQSATERFVKARVFPHHQTLTVYNFIDTEKFCPAPRSSHFEFHWLAVGRMVEEKDYPTLISAFEQLPEGRLTIIGKGPLFDLIQTRIRQSPAAARIHLAGIIENVLPCYQQADGLVLSSSYEGYGLVVGEAMSAELPVVVTASGGPGELLGKEAVAGYQVPIKDAQALSTAMQRIQSLSAESRQLMGQAGRARIQQHFSLPAILNQWEEIYQSLSRPVSKDQQGRHG